MPSMPVASSPSSAASATPADIVWRRQAAPLKACAGDLTVCTFSLDLMVAETPFADLPAEIDLNGLPSRPSGAQGYLIRSCPADGKTWRMRWDGRYLLYAPRRYDRYWTALSGTFDDYLAGLSGKTRSTLRRKVRKFEADAGGRDFRVYKTPAEMDAFYELARKISEKSYQERLMDAGLPTDPTFQDEMRERAAADQVRAFLLFHEGTPVAYTLSPIDDGVVMYDYTGFDPAYRALSPGTVLQFLLLEDLFAEGGHRRFDFTEGEGAHKALFGTHDLACMDLYILRFGLGTLGSVMIQTLIERGTEFLASGLERIGAKRHLKSLLRRT